MMWFEQFIYIFNHHWDKVDNYRIDKYLMFLRFMLRELFVFLKAENYSSDKTKWYRKIIFRLFKDLTVGDSAPGIILQICDTFIAELNKVDKDTSL